MSRSQDANNKKGTMPMLMTITHEQANAFRVYMRERGERLTCGFGRLKMRTLYQIEILYFFSPRAAICRVLFNWIGNIITLLLLFGYESKNAEYVGATVLFLGTLNLHFSHGFVQYPSIARWCRQQDMHVEDRRALSASFEEARDIASAAYHGDCIKRSQLWQIIATLPWTLPMHLIAFMASSACCFWSCLSSDQDETTEEVLSRSGAFGLFVACLFFPIIYVTSDRSGILLAQFGLIATENLYDSMFFRHSFRKFLQSFVTGIFDFGLVDDVDLDMEADTGMGDMEMGSTGEGEESEEWKGNGEEEGEDEGKKQNEDGADPDTTRKTEHSEETSDSDDEEDNKKDDESV